MRPIGCAVGLGRANVSKVFFTGPLVCRCTYAVRFVAIGTRMAQPQACLVKPSRLQFSLPTPWCTKKSPVGSYFAFTPANLG